MAPAGPRTAPRRAPRATPHAARCAALVAAWWLGAALAGCGGTGAGSGASPVGDSTYVAAMGDLLKLDRQLRGRPRPPLPAPAIGRLSSDTSWKIARRADSLQQAAADSTARAAVLRTHGVTEAQLEATAVRLTTEPMRARLLWEAITRRAQDPAQGAATPPG